MNIGLKMYSLNEKNEYSLVLIEDELEDLGMIHEVNENKFIFSVQKVHTNYFYQTIEMYLGTMEIKNATKEELDIICLVSLFSEGLKLKKKKKFR